MISFFLTFNKEFNNFGIVSKEIKQPNANGISIEKLSIAIDPIILS